MAHLRRLLGRRRARVEAGELVIEGRSLLVDALDAGWPVRSVYVDGEVDLTPDTRALLDRAVETGASVDRMQPGVIERIADTVTPQPWLAIAVRRSVDLEAVASPDPTDALPAVGPILVLAGVGDPGNAGTLLRSAEASGASAVVFTAGSVDPFGPKTVRASAGAIFSVPVVEADAASEALDELGSAGWRRVGSEAGGAKTYDESDLTGRIAIVMGSEAHGLEDSVRARLDDMVNIPMVGRAESLNVAMAGTLLCFEALRQRRTGSAGSDDVSI